MNGSLNRPATATAEYRRGNFTIAHATIAIGCEPAQKEVCHLSRRWEEQVAHTRGEEEAGETRS